MTNVNEFAKALAGRTMTVVIGARSGDGQSVEWKVDDMPAEALMRVFEYGAQRIFNDRVGGSDTTVAQKREAVEAMIEAFKRGEVRRVATGGMSQDDKDLIAAVRGMLPADKRKAFSAKDKDEQLAIAAKIRDASEANAQAIAKAIDVMRKQRAAKPAVDLGGIEL